MKTCILLLFCYVGIVMIFTGCITGLHRTNLDEFQRKKLPLLGIIIDLPKKQTRLRLANRNNERKEWRCKICTFSLHPVYHGFLTEPLYLINVHICILDKNAYNLYLKNKHSQNGIQEFENTKFHDTITEFKIIHPNGRTPLLCFRKDYKNKKTGEVVLAAATYLDNYYGNIKYKAEDIKAIKHILNSIRFLKH